MFEVPTRARTSCSQGSFLGALCLPQDATSPVFPTGPSRSKHVCLSFVEVSGSDYQSSKSPRVLSGDCGSRRTGKQYATVRTWNSSPVIQRRKCEIIRVVLDLQPYKKTRPVPIIPQLSCSSGLKFRCCLKKCYANRSLLSSSSCLDSLISLLFLRHLSSLMVLTTLREAF